MNYYVSNLFHEFTIDVLLIHYRDNIFFVNLPWIHFDFVNALWIHYIFRQLTMNSLTVSQINNEFTVHSRIHYKTCSESTKD